jgi:hypothetical protein
MRTLHALKTAGPKELADAWAGACPRQRDRCRGRETTASGAAEGTGSHVGRPLRGVGATDRGWSGVR